jgi:hypothetical protein
VPIVGKANVISANRFEIPFPFGHMPNLKLDHVTVLVGISYGLSSYSMRNMTFYDSTCRSCSNGVLDSDLVIKKKKKRRKIASSSSKLINYSSFFKVARLVRVQIEYVQ